MITSVLPQRERPVTFGFALIKVLVAGLCLYLAFVAVTWGIADYRFRQTTRLAEAWGGRLPSTSAWHQAYGHAQQILSLDPTNPNYNDFAAWLAYVGMLLTPGQQATWGKTAEGYYRAALAVRPKWPPAWSGLALVKVRLGHFDARLDRAILNATRFGAWNAPVLRDIAAMGSVGLSRYPQPVQAAIAASDARGLMSPQPGVAPVVLNSLRHYPRRDLTAMMPAIGKALLARHWRHDEFHRETTLARITLTFWDFFRPGERGQLLSTSLAAAGDRVVLGIAARQHKLLVICPRVPAGAAFDQWCANRRLTRSKSL